MERKKIEVILSPSAQRDLEGLDVPTALWIAQDIKTYLAASSTLFGKTRLKKITGFNPPLYRLRSGDFRVYYRIAKELVVVLAITRKKDSEKKLKTLK